MPARIIAHDPRRDLEGQAKWGATAGENEVVRRVEKVASDKGWAKSQVALAWIGEKVTTSIVRFSSVSRCVPRSGVRLLT